MRRVRRLRTSRAPSRSCIAGIRQVTRISQTTPLSRAVPPNFVVAVRQLGKEEADATRTQIVHYLLRRVVTDLKARLDPASFLNCGWNELEAFVDALLGGGMHPALIEWETTKDGAGRRCRQRGNNMPGASLPSCAWRWSGPVCGDGRRGMNDEISIVLQDCCSGPPATRPSLSHPQ
jgi:hypothetical protein